MALALVPIEERSAVEHVPNSVPKIKNNAQWTGRMPADTIVRYIAIEADEDWITTVNSAPNRMSNNGKLTVSNRLVKKLPIGTEFLNASLIRLSPTNNKPRNISNSPIIWTF